MPRTRPNRPADPPEVDCELGWSIGLLMRNYQSKTEQITRDIPRGARGYQLLYAVSLKDIPNQLRLAEYLGIDRSVMPYVIDDLVEAGLVERRPDPADRRARKVVATRLGREAFRKLQRGMAKAEHEVLRSLDAAEQREFRRLLSRLARQARDEGASAQTPTDRA